MSAEGGPRDRVIGLQGRALDRLLPMHLWFGAGGRVMRAGPTLCKLLGEAALDGRDLFSLIDIRSPRQPSTVAGLLALDGQRLNLRLSSLPDLPMRGQVQALPSGAGGLLNVSLGLSFAEAVERRGLTLQDFSPCDQTVDLMYLREAVGAISDESRQLTDRLIASERAAEARAAADALTGLANRRALSGRLAALIGRAGRPFALLHVDLDFFKQVNDTLGHAAGDAVLKQVAKVLRSEIRENDLAARVGGDEFVLLLLDCDSGPAVDRIARRITARLCAPMVIEGHEVQIGASIGSTRSSFYAEPEAEQMLRDADEALYASKHAGRGQHTVFQPEGAERRCLP